MSKLSDNIRASLRKMLAPRDATWTKVPTRAELDADHESQEAEKAAREHLKSHDNSIWPADVEGDIRRAKGESWDGSPRSVAKMHSGKGFYVNDDKYGGQSIQRLIDALKGQRKAKASNSNNPG